MIPFHLISSLCHGQLLIFSPEGISSNLRHTYVSTLNGFIRIQHFQMLPLALTGNFTPLDGSWTNAGWVNYFSQGKDCSKRVAEEILYFKICICSGTLPETSIAPENRPKPKRKLIWTNPSVSGCELAVSFREATRSKKMEIFVSFRFQVRTQGFQKGVIQIQPVLPPFPENIIIWFFFEILHHWNWVIIWFLPFFYKSIFLHSLKLCTWKTGILKGSRHRLQLPSIFRGFHSLNSLERFRGPVTPQIFGDFIGNFTMLFFFCIIKNITSRSWRTW